MGVVNRDLVLQHHSARDHVIALLGAIGERVPQERAPAPLQELARLVALQWSWELTAREFRAMHWPLREHAARSEQASLRAGEAARIATERAERAEAERDAAAAACGALQARLDEAQLAAATGARRPMRCGASCSSCVDARLAARERLQAPATAPSSLVVVEQLEHALDRAARAPRGRRARRSGAAAARGAPP